jgi:hypothetical protein
MDEINLLLTHGVIVTQDDARRVIADGAVAIRGDRIAAVGPGAELIARFRAHETWDLQGQAVFPGLINTHTHLFQVSVKGLGEDMPVQEWVRAITAPTAIHIQPDEMYLCCLTGCLDWPARCGWRKKAPASPSWMCKTRLPPLPPARRPEPIAWRVLSTWRRGTASRWQSRRPRAGGDGSTPG